jgi:nitric oxide reductase subunit C
MTKRQTRMFFAAGTTLFSVTFIALTIDSHRQFGRLTHEEAITPAVVAGKHVWHRKDCVNCHTLLGEGAYYAPDLTKITQLRGEPYLRQFLKDPSRFYSEEQHGRLMPNPNLSEDDITNVIAFLDWVSHIDNNNWPPRPIVVSAATAQGIMLGTKAPGAASNDPVALGEALFGKTPPACFSCHSTQPNVQILGPSLAGVSNRAADVLKSSTYTGKARTPEEYIRESIENPSAYIVPGPTFSAAGKSIMPAIYHDMLKPEDIDHLVAYLATLK